MPNSYTPKPKNCPFCGRLGEVSERSSVLKGTYKTVKCINSKCCAYRMGVEYASERKAVEAWNRRALTKSK